MYELCLRRWIRDASVALRATATTAGAGSSRLEVSCPITLLPTLASLDDNSAQHDAIAPCSGSRRCCGRGLPTFCPSFLSNSQLQPNKIRYD